MPHETKTGQVLITGARSATSPWRSQIFELENSNEIHLPFSPCEKILLLHVDDVARMLVILLKASRPTHATYNACCEPVAVSELKRELESLRPNRRVSLASEASTGNPQKLDCGRFEKEFNFRTISIFERLRGSGQPAEFL